MTAALAAATDAYGTIDVLEFSPADRSPPMTPVLEVERSNLDPQLEFYLYRALNTLRPVLDRVIQNGKGTMIVTTGGGSIAPSPAMGYINIAAAALRNWVLNLHAALKPRGVHVAHMAISTWINSGPPDADAAVIARE